MRMCVLAWKSVLLILADWPAHPFNGPFSGTTQLGRYQKGKTKLDFTEARDSEWQWMPFLPPNQQRQSTEGTDWPAVCENVCMLTNSDFIRL